MDTIKDIFSLKGKWQKKEGLILAEILFLILGYRICVILKENGIDVFHDITYFVVVIVLFLIISFGIFIVWYFTNKIHKIPKGNIGILFAIESENEKEKQRLISDFKDQVKSIVQVCTTKKVECVFANEEQTKKMIKKDEFRVKCLENENYTIILCGKIKMRKDEGKNKYVVEITKGTVAHKFIPLFFSNLISQEAHNIIPDERVIDEDNELSGFKFFSQYVGLSIKFIIGVAYMYSEMYKEAYSMHSNCLNESGKISDKKVRYIKEKSKKYAAMEAAYWASRCIKEENIQEGDYWVDTALKLEPKNYYFLMTKSVSYFLLGRIEDALKIVNNCQNSKNYIWAYNKAFLSSYIGDFDSAYKIYKNLSDKPVANGTANECDVFIEKYLAKHKDKYELYYALGMIRYKIREDFELAIDSFSKFMIHAKEKNSYNDTVKHVEDILEKCSKHMAKK